MLTLQGWGEHMETGFNRRTFSVLRCVACKWCGDDPSSRVSLDSYEFWGQRGSHISHELACPDCGDDVDETIACAECRERPIEVSGTDFCKPCLARIEQEEFNGLAAAARAISRKELVDTLIDITRSAA